MPVIECGPSPYAPHGQGQLSQLGPTVLIDVGFDMAYIAQAPGVGALGIIPPTTGASSVPTSSLVRNVPALIDTGATTSCIDNTLAQQLQLPLINQAHSVGAHGGGMLNVYLAFLAIPALGVIQAG